MRIVASQKVFLPRSTNDAVAILRQRPGSLVFAGGTEIQNRSPGEVNINQDVVALHNIEEMRRIYRSDRMLDVGSMVTLERLSRFSREVVPRGLTMAILSIPHAALRSVATMGGNLLVHSRYFSTYHYLNLVDARVELKRSGGSRWIPISRLRDGENNPQLHQELLTRIRVPVNVWSHQNFRRYYSREQDIDYGFCGLASVHRGIIEDLRIAYLFSGLIQQRNRDADSLLIGRRLPIPEKDLRHYVKLVHDHWRDSPSWEMNDELMRERLQNLSAWFIHSLNKS